MTTTVETLKPTLSPTALGAYDVCGRRGQYYHDPDIPGQTTLGLALGSAWHHAMETYGTARLQLGDQTVGALIPEDLANLYPMMVGHLEASIHRDDFVWPEEVNDPAQPEITAETARTEAHDRLYTMLHAWSSEPSYQWMDGTTPIEAVEQEVRVELDSPHHQFRGFIDSVYRAPTYGPIGVDFKTAGRAWSHQKDGLGKGDGNPRKLVQAPLYAEAWLRLTGEEMNWFAYDVMTYAGKFERVFVDVNAQVRDTFIRRWREVSSAIHLYGDNGMDMPHNPDHMLCSPKWCSYWDICDLGEGLARRQGQ